MILLNAADAAGDRPGGQARAGGRASSWSAVDVAAAGADATVQTNNVQAGEIACQYIADKLGDAGGNVIIQNGPQVGAVIDRVNGLQGGPGQEPEDQDPVRRPGRQGHRGGRPERHAGPSHPLPRHRRGVHDQRPAGDRQRPRRQAARPQRASSSPRSTARRTSRRRSRATPWSRPRPARTPTRWRRRRSRSATRS